MIMTAICDNPSFDVSSKDDRGVGASNKKFAERFNQRETQLYHQQFDAEVRKLDSVLRSKGGQRGARTVGPPAQQIKRH